MLGSLARWLRFFGYDTAFFESGVPDDELARLASVEGRWLLTRDRELAAVGPRTMMVRSEDLESQLTEVFNRLGLRPAAELERARCGECNGELITVAPEEIQDVVPPFVLETAPRFRRCSVCRRVYWPGTHSERILETMGEVLARCKAADDRDAGV
jgi:uncharacterized protein with PIN domain